MIDRKQFENILIERKKLHSDDSKIMQKWLELIEVLGNDEDEIIEYLNGCNEEEVRWLCEIFEDISKQLKSLKFIRCIEMLQIKYPNLELKYDILYAKKYLLN